MLQRMNTINVVISDWLTMIIELTAVCCSENLVPICCSIDIYFNPKAGVNYFSFIRENDLFIQERVGYKLCR